MTRNLSSVAAMAATSNPTHPSVCFVSLNNYAVLSGRRDLGHIGGAETQQALIARALAHRGYRIRFVTQDHGQPDAETCDRVRVYKTCPSADGWPGLRFIHPRWTSLWRAMSRADADIYYQRTGGILTGQVAAWCWYHRRPFVFGVSHEFQCDRRLPGLPTRRERMLYRYGLKRADRIITQTRRQRRLMKRAWGCDSIVIPNCAAEVDTTDINGIERLERPRVLWVGRIVSYKRVEQVLELARSCPEVTFDMVGDANIDSDYSRNLRAEAERLPNVVLHGRVPHAEIGDYYDRAAALLLTSTAEGFPNTFLEAWSRGVPVVTSWDVDDVVRSNRLGVVAADTTELSTGLRELLASRAGWSECSRRVRTYFRERHTTGAAAGRYAAVFDELVRRCGIKRLRHGVTVP